MRYCTIQNVAHSMLCTILLGLAGAASADESSEPRSVAGELLEILRAAGTIDDTQYRELRERARAEEAERVETVETATLPAVSAAPNPEANPEDWKFKWSDGFKLERNDAAFKLKFGGRMQIDWAVVDLSERLENAIGGEGHGAELRRAFVFVEGEIYERLIFKAQYNFANTGDGEVDVKDAFIGLKDLGPLGTVMVGHFREPFSLESKTSDKYITLMERSLRNVFSLGRNTGFMANNAVFGKRVLWQVGTFMDANNSAFSFDDDGMWNVTARLVGVPLYEDDGRKVVHMGFSYSHQFRGGNYMLRYRQRPESHLAPYLADTGSTIPTNDIDLINPEFAVVWGPASFQAEYSRSFVQGDDGTSNSTFWGAYALLSYFITGEHRNYKLGAGKFGRVKPNANFNPEQGDWGAFELAARYSYLDLNDEFVRGGKVWGITAGVNWHLYPNTRISLNYVHSELDDRIVISDPEDVDGHTNIVEARFQFDF